MPKKKKQQTGSQPIKDNSQIEEIDLSSISIDSLLPNEDLFDF